MKKKIGSNQYRSRYSRFKIFMHKVTLALMALLLLYTIFFIGGKMNYRVVYKSIEKQVILDNLTEKVNELKGQLVSEIKSCESAGYDENYGLITFDPHRTNKKVEEASIGEFQFKKSTVKYYYRTFYGKEITGKEAVLIALDTEKASELATRVIFETEHGLDNWINCSKKYNSQNKLDIINSLIK